MYIRFNYYHEFKLVLLGFLVFSHVCEQFYESVIERILASDNLEQDIDKTLKLVQTELYTRFFQYLVGAKDILIYGVAKGADQVKRMTDQKPSSKPHSE